MTMTTTRKHHGRVIDTQVRIRTTPDQAWRAWADPQQIANWFVDRAEGSPRPGEVMTWIFDTFNYRMPVPIVEAEPGQTFVTGSGDAPGPQGLPYLMEITIARDGDDTVVRLVNSGFSPDAKFDDEYGGVVSGWVMALATMKHWLERYPTWRRTHRLEIQPAAYTPEALAPLLRTEDGRRRWLEPLMPAATPVIADSGREVLLAWEEQQAVMGLKAFRMGPQQVIALDLSAWGPDTRDLEAAGAGMREALSRLSALLHSK
jgi:uncharacterized protein YndB with AHSA1/START domain